MANIHGFGGNNKGKKPQDHEELSVGGASSQSAVMRPNTGGGIHDQLLERARQNQHEGAEAVGQNSMGNITLYKNGFIIGDDGEFRDSKDPDNERCLRELMEGNVPRELEPEVRRLFPGAHQVGVNLVNRTQEEFVPPKPKFDFAKSQGQSLGGGAAANQAELVGFAEAIPRQLPPAGDDKAGAIQLVLADKRKVRLEVSRDTRVLDVFQHAMSLSGLGPDEFVLVAGFPPKPLEDPAQVLAEAKLVGSSFTQRQIQKQ